MYTMVDLVALRSAFVARGTTIPLSGCSPRTGNHYFYADAFGELPHYVEYIFQSERGKHV